MSVSAIEKNLLSSYFSAPAISAKSGISAEKIEFLEGRATKIFSDVAIRHPNGIVTRKEIYYLPQLNKKIVVLVEEFYGTPAIALPVKNAIPNTLSNTITAITKTAHASLTPPITSNKSAK
jgi:hypothetical protein